MDIAADELVCLHHLLRPVMVLSLPLQLTVYLGKRDFVDHLDHVDPVGKFLTEA